jgi:hypothetical protein
MRKITCIALLGVLMGLFVLSAWGDEREVCLPCNVDRRSMEGSCPYHITIQCWCEVWPAYVCCIRQVCTQLYDFGPCTLCWFYEQCYVLDCSASPPESALLWPGVLWSQ